MVSRTAVTTMTLALGLAVAGCTGPGSQATPSESPTQTTESAPETAPESEDPTATAEAEVELPDYLEPYPDAEVVSSSRAPAESGELEQLSLVMRAEADPKDIIDFYTEHLETAGFETFGSDSTTKSGEVVNFRHQDNGGMLVITVSEDPDNARAAIVTIGGIIAP